MELRFPLRSAFLALPLLGESADAFRDLQERLRPFEEIFRFQNPESPHLTLQFWHEIMQIEHDQIVRQAEKIAAASAPFSLRVLGVSTFGHRGAERVLFLDVPFNEDLAKLKKRCPWPSEREDDVPGKPFSPHITLARMKHPQRFAANRKKLLKLVEDAGFEMRVDRLRFYAEVDGRKQTMLRDFPLAA